MEGAPLEISAESRGRISPGQATVEANGCENGGIVRSALDADALRTSIAKAWAAAVPLWSPHDLRHRRISLLHLRGTPWARIGDFVGQPSLSVTADVYSHILTDETELDYAALLERDL